MNVRVVVGCIVECLESFDSLETHIERLVMQSCLLSPGPSEIFLSSGRFISSKTTMGATSSSLCLRLSATRLRWRRCLELPAISVFSIDDVRSCTAGAWEATAATGATRRIQQANNLPNPITTEGVEGVVGVNLEGCCDRRGPNAEGTAGFAKSDAIKLPLIS